MSSRQTKRRSSSAKETLRIVLAGMEPEFFAGVVSADERGQAPSKFIDMQLQTAVCARSQSPFAPEFVFPGASDQ